MTATGDRKKKKKKTEIEMFQILPLVPLSYTNKAPAGMFGAFTGPCCTMLVLPPCKTNITKSYETMLKAAIPQLTCSEP